MYLSSTNNKLLFSQHMTTFISFDALMCSWWQHLCCRLTQKSLNTRKFYTFVIYVFTINHSDLKHLMKGASIFNSNSPTCNNLLNQNLFSFILWLVRIQYNSNNQHFSFLGAHSQSSVLKLSQEQKIFTLFRHFWWLQSIWHSC